MFALRARLHTKTQNTSAQLLLRRDSILNTRQKANWQIIKKRKQELINKRNHAIEKNTRKKKGPKSYLKIRRKPNSTRMRIWALIQSQLSERKGTGGTQKR